MRCLDWKPTYALCHGSYRDTAVTLRIGSGNPFRNTIKRCGMERVIRTRKRVMPRIAHGNIRHCFSGKTRMKVLEYKSRVISIDTREPSGTAFPAIFHHSWPTKLDRSVRGSNLHASVAAGHGQGARPPVYQGILRCGGDHPTDRR